MELQCQCIESVYKTNHKLKNFIVYQMSFQISYHLPKGDVRKHEVYYKEVKVTNFDQRKNKSIFRTKHHSMK